MSQCTPFSGLIIIDIEFADHFKPRPYQVDLFEAVLIDRKKRVVRVGHRRYGKDTECFNLSWLVACTRPGLYFYLLPTIGQARSVIWEGRGKDGQRLIDRIPRELIADKHSTTMKIYFVNGSILHITGGDNYEAIVGSNPLGVVMSEYQNMSPLAWDLFLRAVLSENDGWVVFNGTPRGHNHLYDLIEQNKDNPKWFISIKTVNDTYLEDGSAVITDEAIEDERAAGMPEDLIAQEFYCSFDAAIRGAYYSEQLTKMREQGRIRLFQVERSAKVYTGWDIGVRDPSSIWLMQNVNGKWRMIYHIEEPNKDLDYFIVKLYDLQKQLGFDSYGMHFVPADIAVREWSSGKSRLSLAREKGIILTPVNKIGSEQIRIIEQIQVVRHCLSKIEIHANNCKHGIRSLTEYHAVYDEKKQSTAGPLHNWASHACSALATLCIGYLDSYDKDTLFAQKSYASYVPLSGF